MSSVFLSHSSKDKAFTRKLAERLEEKSVNVWLDEAELNVGDSLLTQISNAIDRTDFVAVILSHNSVQSTWVQTELKMAMTKELADKKVKVLPIKIESCEMPLFLKDKLYADFTNPDDFDAAFSKLLRALGVDTKHLIKTPDSKRDIRILDKTKTFHDETSSLQEFIDINIVGVDRNLSQNTNPDDKRLKIHLILSAFPPKEWVDIFDAERRFPRHNMWRRAWIEGKNLIIFCVPEELKKYHLEDLKIDVMNSNQKYRDQLLRLELIKKQEMKKKLEEENSLSEALEGLNFDA